MGIALVIYMQLTGIPFLNWRYLTGEGNFGQVVLLLGLLELITYRIYERRGGVAAQGGQCGCHVDLVYDFDLVESLNTSI